MKSMRILWIASALAACGLLLWSHAGGKEQPASSATDRVGVAPQAGAETAAYRALRGELHRLRQQLHELQSGAENAAGHDAAPHRKPDASVPQAQPDPYQDLDPVERDSVMSEDFAALLRDEPVDEAWRAETEELFSDLVANIAAAELTSVECRSTLCRVEVEHPGSEERITATDALTTEIPWDAEGFVHMTATEPPTSIVYIAREGHGLPSLW